MPEENVINKKDRQTETERQTDRQTDRQTERLTDKIKIGPRTTDHTDRQDKNLLTTSRA